MSEETTPSLGALFAYCAVLSIHVQAEVELVPGATS
jgi:hypothetical protein